MYYKCIRWSVLWLMFVFISCKPDQKALIYSVIPKPNFLKEMNGQVLLSDDLRVYIDDESLRESSAHLTGFGSPIKNLKYIFLKDLI